MYSGVGVIVSVCTGIDNFGLVRTRNMRIDGSSFLVKGSWCCTGLPRSVEIFLTAEFFAGKLSDSWIELFSIPSRSKNAICGNLPEDEAIFETWTRTRMGIKEESVAVLDFPL